jgi:integrin-linked kinase-associated serine/threonine phosphatase 2C|mmetsp:Transcript_51867/g.152883  ORF Transcript_51867/g.152883 Transcript_51867/m.152883 type:complete len:414 (-) Transcript_51867:41-1282(-)
MRIFIRPPDGTKKDDVEMDLNVDELIESVRKRIQDKKGMDAYKLMHKGITMKDDRTLRSYDVPQDAVLMVQSQYHGQYLPMGVTPAMEKRKAEDLEVEPLAPEAKRAATAVAEQNLAEANISWVGVGVAAHGEKGMRRQMEDEHLICPSLRDQVPSLPKERDFACFAIFDGHGGKQVAGFIKTYLAVEIGTAFAAAPEEGPLSDKKLKLAVETAFQRLDSRIAVELQGCYDGCTAVVVLVNQEICICANLGDSMAYLCRKNDEEEIQSIPLQQRQHKCWMMKEKERILRSGGAVENGRINGVLEVSRAFGDITLKKFGVLCTPEYMKYTIDREKDKFVILACDGFWNAWTANEALEHTSDLVEAELQNAESEGRAPDLRGVCRELVTHVVEEKKAQDNVSVLIFKHAGEPASE